MIVNQNLSKLSCGSGEKQSQEIIIKNVRILFKLKKENEAIKHRMIRDIRTLIEKEKKDYKPMRVGNFGIIISNIKIVVTETKTYQ